MVSVGTTFVLVLSAYSPLAPTVFAIASTVAVAVLVLRGSRIVWSFAMASALATPAFAIFATLHWWSVVIAIVNLACLLAPASRAFVWRPRMDLVLDRSVQTTWDPSKYADSDRPAGWYLEPGAPWRMRYWNVEDAAWTGTTRTPRKIKKSRSSGPAVPSESTAALSPRTVQTTWDPEAYSDADRPAGWYVDRSQPHRMRYWNVEDAQWTGTTRTPRKIQRTITPEEELNPTSG